MSYRDTTASLQARRERLAADLDEARRAANEARERAARVQSLERELAEADGMLQQLTRRRGLPLLESVQVAAPCSADWDAMIGDERVRFCAQCAKNVYNLSALPREEAEALLLEKEGKLCVRLYKRADGTVLTSDCPVGVRRRRRRRIAALAIGGGLAAAAAASAQTAVEPRMGAVQPVTVMGEAPPIPHQIGDVAPSVGHALMGAPVRTPPTRR
jgi:hypothetical protein